MVGILSLLTACSDAGDSSTGGQRSGSAASAVKEVGARAALTGFACEADKASAWSATGTLNNAEKADVTYLVKISVAGKNSNVVAAATKKVTVDAQGEAELKAPAFGKADGKDLKCSAHVTRVVS
jgi:hypothetical protein